MTYHSLIILAFNLLNLFYNINGRSIQCPSDWIPNGDEGKTLLKNEYLKDGGSGGEQGDTCPQILAY